MINIYLVLKYNKEGGSELFLEDYLCWMLYIHMVFNLNNCPIR